jgi:hypothetical protein
MRLLHYINEDRSSAKEIVDILRDKCAPFLKELKKHRYYYMLYRGSKKHIPDDIMLVKSRKDRKPKDTPPKLSKILDDMFFKKFGWRARSEGVFATPSFDSCSYYGCRSMFFPVGQFKYVWSPDIKDLYGHLDWRIQTYFDAKPSYILDVEYNIYDEIGSNLSFDDWKEQFDIKEYLMGKIRELIEMYTNKGISRALESDCEMSFKCKEYYLVNNIYEDDIINTLRGI